MPRNTHALAYDPDTDRLVLFGGDNGVVSLDDTWVYDYSANRWTKVETDVHPSARDYAQLVYDSDSRRMVLFGGLYYERTSETLCEAETWTFDVTSLTWEQIRDIHTGKTRNWREVGGKDQPITVFSDTPTGGTRAMIKGTVMGGKEYASSVVALTAVIRPR